MLFVMCYRINAHPMDPIGLDEWIRSDELITRLQNNIYNYTCPSMIRTLYYVLVLISVCKNVYSFLALTLLVIHSLSCDSLA